MEVVDFPGRVYGLSKGEGTGRSPGWSDLEAGVSRERSY